MVAAAEQIEVIVKDAIENVFPTRFKSYNYQ